jgi:hypothetical protein
LLLIAIGHHLIYEVRPQTAAPGWIQVFGQAPSASDATLLWFSEKLVPYALSSKGTNFIPDFNLAVGMQDGLEIFAHSGCERANEGSNKSTNSGTHTAADLHTNISTDRGTA